MTQLSENWTKRAARLASRRRSRLLGYIPLGAAGLDLLVVAIASGIAVWGRSHLGLFPGSADVRSDLSIIGPFLVLGWLVVIRLLGGYQADVFGAGTDEYRRMLNAGLVAMGLTGITCYFLQYQLSRGFFLLIFAVGIPALILGRWILRRLIHLLRSHGSSSSAC